jgi:hypothetical protein
MANAITGREAGWGGAPALPYQGEEVVFDLAGITGILKTPGGFAGETVAVVQFTEPQAAGI